MTFFRRYHHAAIVFGDIVALSLSYWLSCLFVRGYRTAPFAEQFYVEALLWMEAIYVAVYFALQLYQVIWRHATIRQLAKLFFAQVLVGLLSLAAVKILSLTPDLDCLLLTFIGLVFITQGYRVVYLFLWREHTKRNTERVSIIKKRLLIIGGGMAAALLLNDIRHGRITDVTPVAIVDDDLSKQGRRLDGVPILGTTEEIIKICKEQNIQAITLCILGVDAAKRARILNLAKATRCKVMKLTIESQEDERVANIQPISANDLLGRAPIQLDTQQLESFLSGRVVLVTGGGGSIGSELCRQIAKWKPAHLIILDVYENNAYTIEQELRFQYGDALTLSTEIASVRDACKMEVVFQKYQPHIVFHAAAHKHVPFMEHSPEEAVKNNIAGTYILAKLADQYQTERFVMVSTDKAVNPTNVMGASKRCCELIVQAMDKQSKTEFVAVRFGNVLGSNGSVIPLFERQIAAGGPVTVTDPEMIRYFMTIPEAAQLILSAGSMAKGGEIFILDMGDPVKILDLAKQTIELAGFIPDVDIEIKFTGLRPGEKLYEELLLREEGICKTENAKIFVGKPHAMDAEELFRKIECIQEAAAQNKSKDVVDLMRELVPTYQRNSQKAF